MPNTVYGIHTTFHSFSVRIKCTSIYRYASHLFRRRKIIWSRIVTDLKSVVSVLREWPSACTHTCRRLFPSTLQMKCIISSHVLNIYKICSFLHYKFLPYRMTVDVRLASPSFRLFNVVRRYFRKYIMMLELDGAMHQGFFYLY